MTNLLKNKQIATANSYGAIANPEHARVAVQKAISKVDANNVGSVLLFLTSGYAHSPQQAILEAVKAAGTPMVFGACAMALLTETEWLLDVEGAVAMVLPREYSLQPISAETQSSSGLSLCITSPNAASIAVNSIQSPQVGAISSDLYGHGPFSVWQSGRIVEREFFHAQFIRDAEILNYQDQNHVYVGKADSIKYLSEPLQVNRVQDDKLIEVAQQTATDSLTKATPENLLSLKNNTAYNVLVAVSESDDPNCFAENRYRLLHTVFVDYENGHIQLSEQIKAGRYICWVMRDPQNAQAAMHQAMVEAKDRLPAKPKFGLLFPSMSRGPEFYNGRDRDLDLFKQLFPNLPVIGFYGHGEIYPNSENLVTIHHYSATFAIFC